MRRAEGFFFCAHWQKNALTRERIAMFELLHSWPETFNSFQVLASSKFKASNHQSFSVDLRPLRESEVSLWSGSTGYKEVEDEADLENSNRL
jgi:hypothetical protein